MRKIVFIILMYALSASAERNDVYVELILDASGSMEEMIGGKTKMQIAKDVLSKYAKKVNQDYHLGLRVYGNTKRKDCKDSHLIVPIEKGNRDQIISEIKEVTALSMTPIGYSLKKAGEDLNPLKDKGTLGIVLVTDGQESCDLDPCKVANDLIKEGFQFKINVVGFDIKDKQAHDQLKCIANATGGTYVTSDNADSLYKMLEKSVETVAKYDWNLRVEAPSSHQSYTLDVIDEKTGKKVLEHQSIHRSYLLPDGTYTIKVNTHPEYVEKNILLTQTKQTLVKIKSFGTLVVRAQEGHETIYMTVKDAQGQVVVDRKPRYFSGYLLPEGIYTVELGTNKAAVLWTKKDVRIEPNKTTAVQMTGFGTLRVREPASKGTLYFTVKDALGKEVVTKGRMYFSGYLIPIGQYTVELVTRSGSVLETKKDVIVEENKLTTVSFK
ncbi:MAG: VWA domain-containing protein [Deltaproteobacteria bacterium]|nr:VWA domain-containing protein [Deltaproteobacteria bacterium]